MYNIIHLPEVDSTIDYAVRNLASLQDRDVILAEIQTKGHGRFNRAWISHIPQNIYTSLILKPPVDPNRTAPLANITQLMSVVISDIFDSYGITAELKWPNDVLVNSAKIAGLLSQSIIQGSCQQGCILGAGINLNMTTGDLDGLDQPATAMNLVTGNPVDRDLFLNHLLEAFFNRYESFLIDGFSSIQETYTQKSTFLGTRIRITLPHSEICGIAKGFSDDGSLLVFADNGNEEKIYAGDVRF